MKIYDFRVTQSLPREINGLNDLAYDLLWSWEKELARLFHSLDPELWSATNENPVLSLGSLNREQIEAATNCDHFMSLYEAAM